MKKVLRNFLQKLLAFLYPRDCISCEHPLTHVRRYLCDSCIALLELSEKQGEGSITTFEPVGPALALIKQLKQNPTDQLIHLLASYMVVRFSQSGAEWPDSVSYFIDHEDIGLKKVKHTASYLLAKKIAEMMQLPLIDVFYVEIGDRVFNQLGIKYELCVDRNNMNAKTLVIGTVLDKANKDQMETLISYFQFQSVTFCNRLTIF